MKNEIKDMNTLAVCYIGGYCGLEIKRINYSFDDTIEYIDTFNNSAHKKKLYYTGSGVYFNHYGRRIHLSECIRTDI